MSYFKLTLDKKSLESLIRKEYKINREMKLDNMSVDVTDMSITWVFLPKESKPPVNGC